MQAQSQDWADGYVVDVDYIDNFHRGLAPLNLAFAALMRGVRPPDVDAPFAYLDLGCGNGFTPALIAATHPHARVWGNDFNPAHIRNARATAAGTGLTNADFLEASFADLRDADLPGFDFVAVHGIWSWVSAAARADVVAVLTRFVKPGGLVMISYNCHPGWGQVLPLRRMLAAERGGTPAERIARALARARALHDAGADFFRHNPAAAEMLQALETQDPAYLAHEYLNAHWTQFHPEEVFDAVAPAGLSYVGQARIVDDIDRFCLTADQSALVAAEPDPAAAQSMRDLILDRRFRRDLYVRDATPLGEGEQAAWIDARRFALGKAHAECAPTLTLRPETIALPERPFAALLDVLAQGVTTGAALIAHSALAGVPAGDIRAALHVLVAVGYVQPALAAAGEGERRAVAARFNAVALDAARMGDPVAALASPVTGSGVPLPPAEQLLLDAARFGLRLDDIGTPGEDGAAQARRFWEEGLPVLAMLGIA